MGIREIVECSEQFHLRSRVFPALGNELLHSAFHTLSLIFHIVNLIRIKDSTRFFDKNAANFRPRRQLTVEKFPSELSVAMC